MTSFSSIIRVTYTSSSYQMDLRPRKSLPLSTGCRRRQLLRMRQDGTSLVGILASGDHWEPLKSQWERGDVHGRNPAYKVQKMKGFPQFF